MGGGLLGNKFAPWGLCKDILEQMRRLRQTGVKDDILEAGLEQISDLAEANSKRFGKPVEYYMRRSVARHQIENWCDGMVGSL